MYVWVYLSGYFIITRTYSIKLYKQNRNKTLNALIIIFYVPRTYGSNLIHSIVMFKENSNQIYDLKYIYQHKIK